MRKLQVYRALMVIASITAVVVESGAGHKFW